jgi:hypothetical protein
MTTYGTTHSRGTAAGVVNLIGTVLALILAAHIVFVLFHADPANLVVRWVGHAASVTGLWFVHLIDTGNVAFSTLLNFGLAAVFWLFVTGLIAHLLRSVG